MFPIDTLFGLGFQALSVANQPPWSTRLVDTAIRTNVFSYAVSVAVHWIPDEGRALKLEPFDQINTTSSSLFVGGLDWDLLRVPNHNHPQYTSTLR